jgi:KaiC/GvpD/RAD55 family RecA-like ATPase
LKVREQYIRAKMEELRQMEQGLVEKEIEAREEEIKMEIKQEKVKTGTPRLDDLLYGGFPLGSNILLYGPAFVGKEVMINAFIAEGLKKGIPGVWVLTDKSVAQIREDMLFVLPTYEEYEAMGLVKYVDAYSKSMGESTEEENTVYIEDATDTNGILRAVDEITAEFKKKHPYYRLAFVSVSTLIAYLDPSTTFKFLQPFVGRRKRDRAVALYSIEKGMHSETDISMLGHLMDGTIEFKVENLRNFLAVRGICDVQSRAWIRYTFSKSGVDMGSFSLDKIR